jgi:hypothetical protein
MVVCSDLARRLERERDEAREDWRISPLVRALMKQIDDAREQRDRLAEALRNLVRWFDPYDCPEAYTQATQALAAVKGYQP